MRERMSSLEERMSSFEWRSASPQPVRAATRAREPPTGRHRRGRRPEHEREVQRACGRDGSGAARGRDGTGSRHLGSKPRCSLASSSRLRLRNRRRQTRSALACGERRAPKLARRSARCRRSPSSTAATDLPAAWPAPSVQLDAIGRLVREGTRPARRLAKRA